MTDPTTRPPGTDAPTFLGTVLEHVRRDPEATAYRFLPPGHRAGDRGSAISRRRLDARARTVAARLRSLLGPGRAAALLVLPPGHDFTAALHGCLYAGVTAVPCPPPRSAGDDSDRIAGIAEDAGTGAVVTTAELAPALRASWGGARPDAHWVEVDTLPEEDGADWQPADAAQDGPVLLQYTSGSTGRPKAVVVDHAALTAQIENFRALTRFPDGASVVSWMPVYHALGLGHLLLAQYAGGEAVYMAPDDFVDDPGRWLRAISDVSGPVLGGGPNFAYERCVEAVGKERVSSFDLSSWHTALVGGERIQPRTLERFTAAFTPAGFRDEALFCAYGLTEAMQIVLGEHGPRTLTVDAAELERGRARVAREGDGGRVRVLTACGRSGPSAEVLVVDPGTGTEAEPGRVGEVWVAGPAVCDGYWQRPMQTEQTFSGRLKGSSRTWLRSGDLAFRHDGRVFLCGRSRELVIIRGRNLHPQDIEASARAAVPELKALPVAAFSVDDEEGERLVVVQAVPDSASPESAGLAEPAGLAERIRRAVASDHEVEAEVVLVEPGQIAHTDSGKVRRTGCRQAYTDGELTVLHTTGSGTGGLPDGETSEAGEALRALLGSLPARLRVPVAASEVRRRLAAATGQPADAIDDDTPLVALGLESLRVIALRYGLERDFKVSLPTAGLLRGTAADLAARIAEDAGDRDGGTPWPELVANPAQRYEPFPLTEIQQAYLVGRSTAYDLGGSSIHLYLEVETEGIDVERLREALDRLVRRQEMLRAVVSADGHQRILPAEEVPEVRIPCHDLSGADEGERRRYLEAVREELTHQVLPLDAWPLFDIRATALGGDRHRIHISLDLLAFDVASVRLFFLEWGDLYADPAAQPPPPDVSFRDFVIAAQQIERTTVYAASRDYWLERVPTLPPGPELPLLPVPEGPAARVPVRRRHQERLDAERWRTLRERAQERGLTPSALLLAAYATVLGTWSSTSHFTVDVPLFSRWPLHERIDDILGDFTSVTLLEVDLRPDDGVAGLATRIQRRLWQDLEHRYFSGVEVMREISRTRGLPASAFASIVFASTREHGRDQEFSQGEWGTRWLGETVTGVTQTPQVLLDHQVFEDAGVLSYNWDAVADRFPAGMVEEMFTAYGDLLRRLADDEEAWSPGGFDPLPAAHRALTEEANDTAGPVPEGHLFSGIADQAREHPARTAVIAPDRRLAFGELYEHACRLGRRLRALGAGPGHLVAVHLPKSAEQVVAAVAAQLSGAAYLPVDPDLPRRRRHTILEQGLVRLALVPAGAQPDLPAGVVAVPVDLDELPAEDGGPLDPVQKPTDPAYVLFTSGSTGEPKGVVQTHRATLNTLVDVRERLGVGPGDVALGLSALSFDLSVWDVFGVLGAGGTLVLPEPHAARDPGRWLELTAEHGVTLWNSVPALLRMLVEHLAGAAGEPHPALRRLRSVWLSGDWIPVDLPDRIRALAPGALVTASGGPTETAIWCVANPLGEVDPRWDSIPYGRPMRNHTIHVLDDRMLPCPVGVPGEMYIGGAGLAEGYWRDEERTAASFVSRPGSGERLYRSGDLGRWLPDGNLEILGRDDLQVKIGGFRVELGEIEAALTRHPEVAEAAVVATGTDRHSRTLAACVVPAASRAEDGRDAYDAEELGEVVTDPVERLEFKARRAGRRTDLDGPRHRLPLTEGTEGRGAVPRTSHRRYDDRPVPQAELARLLEPLSSREDGPFPKYAYASAGSLYPVQTYLYVAEGRVEGLTGGTYYADPATRELVSVEPGARLPQDVHVEANRATFAGSAFSVFLVADREAIDPLYGRRSRDFCLLEAGLMAQLLDTAATEGAVGLCQLGLVRSTPALRAALRLKDGHEVLHALVGGLRPEQKPTGPGEPVAAPGPADGGSLPERLRAHLSSLLPSYMVPATVTEREALPLTGNGKVDRGRLAVSLRAAPRTGGYVAAEGDLERTVQEVAQRTLGIDSIGVTDNFFDLGATSVRVVQVHRELSAALGRTFPLLSLFEHTTVRRLAEFLDGGGDTTEAAREGRDRAQLRRAANRRTPGRRPMPPQAPTPHQEGPHA
ncbi:non-ribosomal peptide synthetase [Streptomyces sp. WMMC897]|uniref:non-ribosomal peptide synthetase n=1 Tax=Streptomyces sp. WMMC897 TaxID=3014782 RepID=UPI0022B6D539|nr:non-ribosomal peptide synthetase [Streptomyces sp. WMMC897]MCZ7415699.1 amino acid adenylation domain-containing protein [Streptomyces sp. WMMC897]